MTNRDGVFGVKRHSKLPSASMSSFAVVERRLALGHVVVGVLAAEHLEAQVGGGAPLPVTMYSWPGCTRVPKYIVSGLSRPILVNGPVPDCMKDGRVVVEGQVGAAGDAPGEVLQALEKVGFGLDEGCSGDQLLGLGDRVDQWLGIHPSRLERVLILVQWSGANSVR